MEEKFDTNPIVDSAWEIREIAEDFAEPFEVFREAISNAYDAHADKIRIEVYEDEKNYVHDKFKIKITDNGDGMNPDQIKKFWSLGSSEKRNQKGYIGSKGHGTLIYLKAKYINVKTTCKDGAFESECIEPMKSLLNGELYTTKTRQVKKEFPSGTEITLEGYYSDENDKRECFSLDAIKDYIYWFTKHGSFEKELLEDNKSQKIKKYLNTAIELKVFDNPEETISFGHIFAKENCDIDSLKKKYKDGTARDHYVKKFSGKNIKISKKYNYTFDYVIYVEGTAAKKEYNPMISDNKKNVSSRYSYKIADRYGIYLCKDYIPIMRANEWITSFGTGSNSYGLLHGFINCQEFKLTANRGSVSIKNREIMDDLKERVQEILESIQKEIYKKGEGLDILNSYKDEVRTKLQEENEYYSRKDKISKKKKYELKNGAIVYEPFNEIETYSIFNVISVSYPSKFDFVARDYSSNIGIDMLVEKVKNVNIRENTLQYAEFKYILGTKGFNHGYEHLSYIICWKVDEKIKKGELCESKFSSEADKWRYVETPKGDFLINDDLPNQPGIEIIELQSIVESLTKKNKN